MIHYFNNKRNKIDSTLGFLELRNAWNRSPLASPLREPPAADPRRASSPLLRSSPLRDHGRFSPNISASPSQRMSPLHRISAANNRYSPVREPQRIASPTWAYNGFSEPQSKSNRAFNGQPNGVSEPHCEPNRAVNRHQQELMEPQSEAKKCSTRQTNGFSKPQSELINRAFTRQSNGLSQSQSEPNRAATRHLNGASPLRETNREGVVRNGSPCSPRGKIIFLLIHI